MAHSLPPDQSGTLIGGRYEVLGRIGQGGQSIVYRGVDRVAGDEVALKVLKAEYAGDADYRERMFREARALTTLRETAAVRVFDQCWTDDGCLCLVTELLYGQELEDRLAELETAGSRVDGRTIVEIFDPVVHTLEAAHEQGIVHRDIKPGNIFLVDPDRGGGVRLLDFGFAKFTRLRGFTQEGWIAGSPSYIAPEAWNGRRDLDQRIDVYSLGAVLYRCLAGEPPFPPRNLARLMREVTTAPRPSLHARRPDLPESIDDWTAEALAIDRDERFSRPIALWHAFRSILGG